MSQQVLLCDLSLAPEIGLAWSTPGSRPDSVRRFHCPTRDAFDAEIETFLAAHSGAGPMAAALSARGWEQNGILHLMGVGFRVDRDDIRALAGVQRVNFINNFVARALAVPGLRRGEKVQVCGGDASDDGTIVVLGPHFGLGLATLVSDGVGGWSALHGEGGHSDMPVKTEPEWRLIEAIRGKNGYASRESGISVAGLMDIWYALHMVAGDAPRPLTSAEIIAAARSGDRRAVEAIDTMTGWLAAMASDLALIVGAGGGVYLTGALLDMIGDLFNTDIFVARYLDKGPRTQYVREIPVFRTQASDMELVGLATLFD